jgi:hypothetical protein
MQTNEDVDDTDDVPRHTIGLFDAEERLTELALGERLTTVYPTAEFSLREDLRLVLNELNGLKQFDPR